MVQNLATSVLLLVSHFLFGQSNSEELIHWSADRKLTWADYKGTAKTGSDVAASTATYLGLEYNFNSKGFDYTITCSFSKTKSWGLHKTDYILSHEQGHFDIAEIFARKLNKQMSEFRFDKKTFKTDLQKIYQDLTLEKETMQNDYDRETNHSINAGKQKEWLKKIEKMLEDYEDFADYK